MQLNRKLSKYAGRTFDISVLHGAAEQGESGLDISLLHKGGAVCTGIQKLIQRFFLLMVTPAGSMTFAPGRGSDFLKSVSRARSESAVQIAFQFALTDVRAQLKAEETEEVPDDERFRDAVLLDAVFFGDSLSLSIALTSQAGITEEIILPVYL